MAYVDGFVLAVKKDRLDEYRQIASDAAAVWKEYGALRLVETWGDDVPEGTLTSFTMAVKREANESVVFSWVEWASKEARDAGWKKIMEDPRMAPEVNPMPFDGKRLIYGGFTTILQA